MSQPNELREKGLRLTPQRELVLSAVRELGHSTPEEIAETIGKALQFVARDKLIPCTNCGLAPMSREVAMAKLKALGEGAALARERYGK